MLVSEPEIAKRVTRNNCLSTSVCPNRDIARRWRL